MSKAIVKISLVFFVMIFVFVGCRQSEKDNQTPLQSIEDGRNKITDGGIQLEGDQEEEWEEEEKSPIVDHDDKKRVKAKGLYLTATSAGVRLSHYINLANTTEINSYVIDVKNDYGWVEYNSQVPLAREIGAVRNSFDIDQVLRQLKENEIYAIARIVCFKDPILAEKKPEFAVKNQSGGLYRFNQSYWVDPYNEDVWQYNIDLAEEVLAKGFDEVQFDYVRFADGRRSDMVFADTRGGKSFSENINDFLAYARVEMPKDILSADIFAIVAESPGDTEGIGQHLETVGQDMDYICLMAYPSHYARGQIINGISFPKPDLDPYGIIKNTLLRAKERLEKVEGPTPIVRTYLQDFTASWIGAGNYQTYGPEQLRQQIQAVYDAGFEEWLVWDHMNNYSTDAFKKN
jgi:hypothetical protein